MKALKKKKHGILFKRNITLLEMMIVMFLIAMILGVIGYNYHGSLEEGKAFKTRAGMEKVKTILTLRAAEDPAAMGSMGERWKEYIEQSHFAQNAKALYKDGWGSDFVVTTENVDGETVIVIKSQKYDQYKQKNPHKFAAQ